MVDAGCRTKVVRWWIWGGDVASRFDSGHTYDPASDRLTQLQTGYPSRRTRLHMTHATYMTHAINEDAATHDICHIYDT